MDVADNDETAFTSDHGFYHFACLPIVLHNALGTFQCIMDVIYSSVKWLFTTVYINEIVVFSITLREHI